METKMLKNSVLFFCLMMPFISGYCQTEKQALNGRIVCGPDSVDFAYLQNLRTHQAVETKHGGRFTIAVQPNDTLKFRCLGYRDTSFVITPQYAEMVAFKVERQLFSLDEVEVKWFYSYASFRQAFLNLKLDDKDKPMKFVVNINYAQMAIDKRFAPGSAGFGIDVAQLVSKGAKMLASQNLLKETTKRDVLYERYNNLISHDNIGSFTNLKGEALDSFIVYLRTKVKIDPTWSDYQILASVKLAFATFSNDPSQNPSSLRR